jgi:hypothetical protein
MVGVCREFFECAEHLISTTYLLVSPWSPNSTDGCSQYKWLKEVPTTTAHTIVP